MAVLPILVAPDPVLKRRAETVERVDDEIRRLMDDMMETMHGARGIGLAAPQVGVLKRVIVVDVSAQDDPPEPYRMANPEVLWEADSTVIAEEGCLSLPDQYADVTRPTKVRIRYRNEHDQESELEAEGLLARCVLHEMDHLEGTLFVDHISSLRRNMILRKLAKSKKQQAPAPA